MALRAWGPVPWVMKKIFNYLINFAAIKSIYARLESEVSILVKFIGLPYD